MPKLNPQGRIVIPSCLRIKLSYTLSSEIAICCNDSKRVYLLNSDTISDEKIICFVKMDNKSRIILTSEVLEYLDACKEDTFIVYLQADKIYIEKLRHGQD